VVQIRVFTSYVLFCYFDKEVY